MPKPKKKTLSPTVTQTDPPTVLICDHAPYDPHQKNPTDPNLLARAIVEAAIGEPLHKSQPKVKKAKRHKQ